MIPDEAVQAAHAAICEQNLDDCLDPDWRGKCVKAVEAAAPHMLASYNKPRFIETLDDLLALPNNTVIRSATGLVASIIDGAAYFFGDEFFIPATGLTLPAEVLLEGES